MPQSFDLTRRPQQGGSRTPQPDPETAVTLSGRFEETLLTDPELAAEKPPAAARPEGQGRRPDLGAPAAAALRQVLAALAREEAAMAHLLYAEAEKVSSVSLASPSAVPFDSLLEYQRSLHDLLQLVVRKEALLLKKLRLVANLTQLAMEERN